VASAVLGLGVVVAAVALAWWIGRGAARRQRLLSACVVLAVGAFCVSPVQNPWYLVGVLPLVAMQRRPFVSVIALTGLVGLRYLNFFYEYRYFPDLESPAYARAILLVRVAQFVPFYLLVVGEWWWRTRRFARIPIEGV
jgi:hypothetical protein